MQPVRIGQIAVGLGARHGATDGTGAACFPAAGHVPAVAFITRA